MPDLFGDKLRRLRHLRGITQSELAQQLGLEAQSHIAKLEHGVAPSLDVVVRVAQRLGVSIDYLLHDTITVDATTTLLTEPIPASGIQPASLGTKLRNLRLQHQWSQTDLVHRLGLTARSYISNLEAGRKVPSIELVLQIADLFSVTTDALLRGEVPIPAEDTT
jgi:transcriptional regulator with XRE-family HTH domain